MTTLNMTKEQNKELRELAKLQRAVDKARKTAHRAHAKSQKIIDRELYAIHRKAERQEAAINKRRNVLLGRLS